ncbi:MAG: NADH:ubiquinone reductase (Na(+)-transporting) subunit E [Candidatus Omnitrophota bacterium]|nr:NADH:ubiquinone reductase (Na(+)-transporting) subunit E [Candidatus Omnitrophota bacterium]MDZ4241439.1 NADH:ubiquinone reductase (Na(+)-transporting) subunit E [Candidatus Omnitrophota bacterium]
MVHYVNLAIKAIFVENILLAFFLGNCSYIACSKKIDTAIGLGIAVIFVTLICTPACWAIKNFLLAKGALGWAGLPGVDLSFLVFIAFIAVIAAMTQIVEMVVEKVSPALYSALGIFLPLIAVNCAILGAALFMDQRNYNFLESVVFGLGGGIGWAMAIVAMAALRKKLAYSNIPAPLRGLGITMLLSGIMSMGFMCFAGIRL